MSGRRAVLFLGGDVMTGRGVDQVQRFPSDPTLFESYVTDARVYVELAERKHGDIARAVAPGYIWGEALAEIERHRPDARIVNLETSVTTSDDAWPAKGINYRMHPSNAGCLAAAKLDVCVLANNHVLDWGRRGLIETIETLERMKLRTAGAGRDLLAARAPAIIELAPGARLLVLAMGAASSGIPLEWAAGENVAGVDLVSLDDATAAATGTRVRALRRPGDVVVASIHWGANWGYAVPDQQVQFAHRLIDDGVDLVHGHSSHHPRGIEVYRDKLILYGCGDLIDDYEGIGGHEAFRGDLVLLYFATLTVDDGALSDLAMVPMRLRRFRLRRASAADATWIASALDRACRPFETRISLDEHGLALR